MRQIKEKKLNWTVTSVTQDSPSVDPQGMAMFSATLVSRALPCVVVTVRFWGSPTGLPGGKFSQAEAFIMAAVSNPVSLETISRVCLDTTQEHAAEGLGKIA